MAFDHSRTFEPRDRRPGVVCLSDTLDYRRTVERLERLGGLSDERQIELLRLVQGLGLVDFANSRAAALEAQAARRREDATRHTETLRAELAAVSVDENLLAILPLRYAEILNQVLPVEAS